MRAEEKGTASAALQAVLLGSQSFRAINVGLLSVSVFTRAVSASFICSSVKPSKGTISSTCMEPSVIVPVLSRQRVSTLARVSTQYMSCTSVFLAESFITLTAKARLISSTSPSGIMPTMAATVLTTEFCRVSPSTKNCFQNSTPPTGKIAKPIIFTIRSMESIISELRFFI